jgi:urea transport system substrate-binding protein
MKRRSILKLSALAAALSFTGLSHLAMAQNKEPIKVGILHSLSGTMAISETSLKDMDLMVIEQINKSGGVLGRKLEPVVVDPASNWPLFAEKARQLLTKDKVAVVFGCWTSVSRKSVLPVFEELNGLLFYPVQYEGEEMSRNVFYTGAAPNQQAIPAVEYLMSKEGGGAKRWVLLGTDYVYPRTTNKILRAFLKSKAMLLKCPTRHLPRKFWSVGLASPMTVRTFRLVRVCATACSMFPASSGLLSARSSNLLTVRKEKTNRCCRNACGR